MSNIKEKKQKFLKRALDDIKYTEEVEKMSYKELADFIIQNIWNELEWGSKEMAAIDRAVDLINKMGEIENGKTGDFL